MKTKIESGFKLSIPLKFREELNIKEDNFVNWSIEDGKIVLEFIEDDTIDFGKVMANKPWDANNPNSQ
ncbi:AbrB/MazE/SpoVT family DNA-binding domain-containing protein [Methanobrevibacter sp.]